MEYKNNMTDKNTKQRKQMIKKMSSRNAFNQIEAVLFIIYVIGIVILIQTMLEIRQESRLETCELRGDCAEIIREINK